MRCGTKCFSITLEYNNETITEKVSARSQIKARKMARQHYGEVTDVNSVRKK